MSSICSFIFKEHTLDGYPVIGAGICPFVSKESIIDNIKKKIKEFKLNIVDDPFYIDYILASYVSKISPSDTYALGISIHVPDISGPSGGIIGNPLHNIASAGDISENIGNGLSVAAYPGGPGIVINGSPEQAEKILNTVNPGDSGLNTLFEMAESTKKYGIDIAIMVTDGTGTVKPGCVLALEKDAIKFLTIRMHRDG